MTVSKLSISVCQVRDVNGFEVKIDVSGRDPMAPSNLLGMDPDDVLVSGVLRPPESGEVEATIARCECGEVGCDWMTVRIRRENDLVIWENVPGSSSKWPLGRVEFSAAEYLMEIDRASSDLSWETPDRSAARLLRDKVDRVALEVHGLRYQWSSMHVESGKFTVSLHAEPGPYQVLVHFPWYEDSPAVVANDIADQLKTDPSRWRDVEWLPQYTGKPSPPKQAGRKWRRLHLPR